jgi:uncharacterized protein YegP (UPF0339 family)/menaquinone-dependent protoporphyrinogen IX oxidase
MNEKTLIVYSTKTGINSEAAHTIAQVLETSYGMDVTVADLRDGKPDITPFKNVIVGGGVDKTNVYDEAVDFLGNNFEDRNVALYFSCEDYETPKELSTEENSRKVLVKNSSLKPIDVAAFGGCMIKQGKPTMDVPNVNRVKDWAAKLGEKFKPQVQPVQTVAPVEVPPVVEKAPEPMPSAAAEAAEPVPVAQVTEAMPVAEVVPAAAMPVAPQEKVGFFEVHCDANGKFRFHLKAANGEIIAQSQAYGSKEAAMKGIASIKKNAPVAEVIDLSTSAT